MKRSKFLFASAAQLPRFKVLRQRGQLPFVIGDGAAEYEQDGFTLDHAFRMRLMLDLVGGESAGSEPLGGLGPSTAANIVSNAVARSGADPIDLARKPDVYLGVAVFDEPQRDGSPLRYSEWVFCEATALPEWLSERTGMQAYGLERTIVRVFMVNASRAARFVLSRVDVPAFPATLAYQGKDEG